MNKKSEVREMSMPWISNMPTHWEKHRAKNMFEKQNRVVRNEDDVVTCFRDGTVTLRKNRRTTGFTESTQWSGYQGIRKGDLVIHIMDAFAGSIGVSDSDGKSTPVYSVCTAIMNLNNYYYAYLLREMARTGFIQSLYRGIRERSSDFRFEVFAGLFLPLPPRDEQDQIVRFLDWKVSRINKLINAKRRQIGLLREQKQAVINEAVTAGSGDWQYRRLKTIVKEINEKGSPRDNIYIGMENIVSWTGEYINIGVIADGDSKTFKIGDALFGKLRPYLAKVYEPDCDGVCSGEFLVLRGFDGHLPFLKYFLLSYDFIMLVNASTYGAKMPRASWDFIGNCVVPLPPNFKQKAIVVYLDEQCKRIDTIINKHNREISLLAEYRTRLISDAVTGALDVRGAVVPEYDGSVLVGEGEEETTDEGVLEGVEEAVVDDSE